MELSRQVCSLELAKRLMELGVEQESCFFWCERDGKFELVGDGPEGSKTSAFTATELGELLPRNRVRTAFYASMWFVELFLPNSPLAPAEHRIVADTEANARAKMFIYLLENKLANI